MPWVLKIVATEFVATEFVNSKNGTINTLNQSTNKST